MNVRLIFFVVLFLMVSIFARQDTVLLDLIPKKTLISVGDFAEEDGNAQNMRVKEAMKIMQGMYPQVIKDTNQYLILYYDKSIYVSFVNTQTNEAVVYKKDDVDDYDFENDYPLKHCVRRHIVKEKEETLCIRKLGVDSKIIDEIGEITSETPLKYSVRDGNGFYIVMKNGRLLYGSSIFDHERLKYEFLDGPRQRSQLFQEHLIGKMKSVLENCTWKKLVKDSTVFLKENSDPHSIRDVGSCPSL